VGGLVRVGWPVPDTAPRIVTMHGIVMVLGFLGTLTSLAHLLRLQPTLHGGILAAGAGLWVGGVLVWLAGRPISEVVPWLGGFLVLTIAGERLELARMVRPAPSRLAAFLAAIGLSVAGLGISVATFVPGVWIAGAGLVLLALWLGVNDVARRTVRRPGVTRFMALALLVGYVWLGVAGVVWIRDAGVVAGPGPDAMLHALFLGFVMSMIFAHAPVIVPSMLGVAMPFRRVSYAHLALLHASLVLWIGADLAAAPAVVRWGACSTWWRCSCSPRTPRPRCAPSGYPFG
jgi:hypothetical protein